MLDTLNVGMIFEKINMSKRKKHLYVKAVGVSILLLFLMRAGYLNLFHSESFVLEAVKIGRRNSVQEVFHASQEHPEDCQLPYLKHKLVTSDSTVRPVSCKRLRPVKNSCQIANRLFQKKNSDDSRRCDLDEAVTADFCRIKGQGHSHQVICNITACGTGIELGILNTEKGSYIWKRIKNNHVLELAIRELIRKPNLGFCLIKCINSDASYHDYNMNYSNLYQYMDMYPSLPTPQILNLPPYLDDEEKNDTRIPKKWINFNLIFIDSVSRPHFFRSLPKTVQFFERMLEHRSVAKFRHRLPSVLDFELVQGIRSRTYESLQALFSGKVNPFEKPFSTLAMPPEPLKTEFLLKPLKDLGYSTLWLEDLCYLWEWGLSKDLLVHDKKLTEEETWKKLQVSMKKAGIDSLGNTYAQCEILRHNEVNDHFHGPDKVCYNSKHQHFYSLEYLRMYQETMHSKGQPYFSFYETNVGHEDSGVRIQDFDSDFMEYLKFLKSQNNTITIIFSDHGNAYGKFMEKSQEARIELFHPFLFLIVPEVVRNILDSSCLKSLITNQGRLVSLLDVHYTLTHLISRMQNELYRHLKHQYLFSVSNFNRQFNVTDKGLFATIPESRTCSQIPRINPNLCICEGHETPKANSPYYFVLAVYAVGELNNHIQVQRREGTDNKNGGFGNCQRLMVEHVENIRESRNHDDTKMVKMDIHVQSPFKNTTEVFFVTIEIPLSHHKVNHLTKFERITSYSQFKACADTGVDLQLCVCDINKSGPLRFVSQSKYHLYNSTTHEKSIVDIDGYKCLHVVVQSNDRGVTLEAFNACNFGLTLEFTLETSNLILSSGNHFLVNVFCNDVTFLTAGIAENEKKEILWSIKMAYQILQSRC